MPTYAPPTSDQQRLLFLQKAAQTAAQDHAAGHTYLSAATLTAITTFLPSFEEAYHQLTQTLSGRSREVREQNEALDHLSLYIRDFWLVLRRRTRRLGHPAEVFQFYGLPLDGTPPNPTAHDQWLAWGEKIAQGEAQAVTAGYPAMSNPSAAEVISVLTTAQAEMADVAVADRVYDNAQQTVADLRPQAEVHIGEAMAELRFYLRHETPPSQRRIMRTYGVKFDYLPGEPVDEEADSEADDDDGE